MYKLYWIKLPCHTNPFLEGYIGITAQNIMDRLSEHKNNSKNKHLKNRCRNEQTQIFALFENLEKQDALFLEEKFRPLQNIGWNINKGGDLPPSRKGKISQKTLLLGENRTEKQKLASKKHSERMKGRKNTCKGTKRVFHILTCLNCHIQFNCKTSKGKYCNRSCAANHRNTNPEYLKLLQYKTKERWKNQEYRRKVSFLIKEGIKKSD